MKSALVRLFVVLACLIAQACAAPFAIESNYVFKNDEAYGVHPVDDLSGLICFDVVTGDERIAAVLAEAARKTDINTAGTPAAETVYRLILKERYVQIHEGTYRFEGKKLVLSSAPYFLWNGSRIFLTCPDRDGSWHAYNVITAKREDRADRQRRPTPDRSQ